MTKADDIHDRLNVNGMKDDPVGYLISVGWLRPRLLPTGEWAAIQPMAYTTGLAVGLDWSGYRTRFCYDGPDQFGEACAALLMWDGTGFPPGYWLKQKPEDIMNPERS